MSKLRALVYCLGFLVYLIPSLAAAEINPHAARGIVETIINKSKTLNQKSTYRNNTRLIESLVDFKAITTSALGSDVAKVSAKQFDEIKDLLKGILTKTVYPAAPKFFKDVQIDFTGEDVRGDFAHIESKVTKGDKHSSVEYWLAPDQNSFKVVDIAIEGERWTENIHSQLDEIIQKKGVPDLIARMRKRLQAIK